MEFIQKLLENAPGLAAACFMVWVFLRHLKENQSVQQEFVRNLADQCHAHSAASAAAMLDCANAHRENTEALGQVRATLNDTSQTMREMHKSIKSNGP